MFHRNTLCPQSGFVRLPAPLTSGNSHLRAPEGAPVGEWGHPDRGPQVLAQGGAGGEPDPSRDLVHRGYVVSNR
jgi:hypothetical protein